MRKVAIIPARGGSKRIPRKNIKNFLGLPAIERTLTAVKASNFFDEISVSTDDYEIGLVAIRAGATHLRLREPALSDDFTPTVPVVADAIRALSSERKFESLSGIAVCCIYPINPFLEISSIQTGYDLLVRFEDVDYVNPICTYPYPVQRSLRKLRDNRVELVEPELALARTQDLEERFHDAGQWYWGMADTWLAGKNLLENSIGVELSHRHVQDIDTLEDWTFAESLFRAMSQYPIEGEKK